MKLIHYPLIVGSLMASLSGLSLAQNAPANLPTAQSPRADRIQSMRQHMEEIHSRDLADLHGKLKLSPGQSAAWQAFAQHLQSPAPVFPRPDPVTMEKLSTPERLDQMLARKAQRDAVMQKNVDITKNFYADLNPEQKKIFDSETFKHMHDRNGNMYFGGGRYWRY
jgi:hypothetical protein